jgi:methylphosphotriester-DNA--protein-cysteine methyltransferase
MFMGNRGVLHDVDSHIRRPWQVRRWLVCVLAFRGRHWTGMTPNRYTELFFLDEATALAAGHRPCAGCRHDRFSAFCTSWAIANPCAARSQRPTADEIDRRLHAERLAPDRSKRTYRTSLSKLPEGVFVRHVDWGEAAYLVRGGGLLAWFAGG